MMKSKSIKRDGFLLLRLENLFLLTWFGVYIVYPSWLLPVSLPARIAIYILYISYFSLNGYLLRRWARSSFESKLCVPGLRGIWSWVRSNPFLMVVLLIAAALHIFPMTLPIANNGDEGVHSIYSLLILRDLGRYTERILSMDGYSFVRIIILLSILGFVLRLWCLKEHEKSMEKHAKDLRVIGMTAAVIFLAGHFYLLRNQEYQIGLFRFPPLGKITTLISYSLFGINELAARLPSLVFSLLTGAVIYQLIGLYRSKLAAALVAGFFLFLPGYFFYSSLAYLEAGAIFFIILSSYYFLRHLKTLSPGDFLLCMFSAGLGFMQRRMLAPIFGVIWIYLIFAKLQGSRTLDWGFYLKCSWIGLVSVVPWLIIGKLYVWRHYEFTPSNWFSYNSATSYLRNMLGQITCPFFILFVVSLIWGLVKMRDDLTVYSLILFAVYYVFFTSDHIVGHPRFMTALFPSVVFISVMFLCDLTERLGRKRIAYGLWILLLAYLILRSPITPVEGRTKYSSDYYFSFDRIFEYMERDPQDKDVKLIYILPLDSAVEFYLIKNRINYGLLNAEDVPALDQFQEYCKKHDFVYLLFAYPNNVRIGDKRRMYELTEGLCKQEGKIYRTIAKLERKQANQIIILGELNV